MFHWAILVTTLQAPAVAPAGDTGLPRPEDYGWSGLIISRFNDGLSSLEAADVDSDGDQDLVVVNNPKARIDFLLQRNAGEPLGDDAATRSHRTGVNELPDEVHFRRDSFATEQKVTSLAIADLNGDQRNDLAFTGDSGKLTVVYRGAQAFGDRVRFDVEEVSPVKQAVRTGDLNGDGRIDVAVLGKKKTFLFLQGQDGRLAAAQELLNATQSPDAFALLDLDGDHHLELLYVKADAEAPLRWRMGRAGGEIGPERLHLFPEIRSYAIADVDGDGRAEVAVVRRRSGRLAVLEYRDDAVPAGAGTLALSSPRIVAYATQKDEKPRAEVLADLDGDGRPELLVAEPSAARLVVYRADPDGLQCNGQPCPSLIGATRPRVADLDGDGRPEVLVAASEEGAIGVSRVDAKGHIGFPEPIGYKGDALLAVEAGHHDGRPAIFALIATGKGAKRTCTLVRLGALGPAGAAAPTGDPVNFDLGSLPTDPNDLWLVDLNRDGLEDAVVFIPTEMPRILLGKSVDGTTTFEPVATQDVPGLGILKGLARSALFHGDVDGDGLPELLVPGPNFARAFTLGPKGVPTGVVQWNLDDGGSKVGAVAAGDFDGDRVPEVVVAEKTTKSLRVLKLVDGAVQTLARVDLGDFEPRGLKVADLDGNGRPDLVLLSPERFAVVQSGRTDAGFTEAIDYETPLKDAHLDEMGFADVNGDGIVDAVVTETSRHLVTVAAHVQGKLAHVLQFPIFEESIFERDGGGGQEPRELVLADVTGDRKTDIAILVHDRILVYPQE